MAKARQEINDTRSAFERLNVAARTAITDSPADNQVKRYQKIRSELDNMAATMRKTAVASGEWRVSTQRVMSQSERINDLLMRQKFSVADIARNWRNVGSAMRQQMRLQQSLVSSMGTQADGRVIADVYTPVGVEKKLRNMRQELGYYNQLVSQVAANTINWGKNTQWAGRQIMVAVGIPLGLAATAAGVLAYQIDSQLTRIAKVYDTTATDQIGREREIMQIRETSMTQAMRLAKEYGAAVKESLDVQAQLAATGLAGDELIGGSSEVVRIASLGEMDLQTATDMTVSLKTAFRLTNEELTETFNLMNSLENATSLSINDFAQAIPRAASALAGLGGTTADMGLLLVAMKESGIEATQGANALKSATTRLLNPTAKALAQFQAMDIDINEIVTRNGGRLVGVFEDLSVEMAGMNELAKQKAIASLFGTYQFNRVNAIVQNLAVGMGLVGDEVNQTTKAYEILGQDSGKWALAADQEMLRQQRSVSGQFKRLFETIKGNLAQLGEPILAAVLPIVKVVSRMLEVFNGLNPGIQKFILIAGGFALLIGPAIMMTGVMANMLGQIVKASTGFANLFLRFRIMNTEQYAQAQLARTAAGAYDVQASSVAKLTLAMQALAVQTARANGLTMLNPTSGIAGARNPAIFNGRDVQQDKNGAYYYSKGNVDANGKSIAGQKLSQADTKSLIAMQTATAGAAKNTGIMNRNLTGAVGTIGAIGMLGGLFAGSMGNANAESQKLLKTIGFISLALVLMPGPIGKGISALAKGVGGLGGKTKNVGAGFSSMGKVITRIVTSGLKFWGPVGILASAVAIFASINSHMKENIRHQEEINKLGEDWANILGYTYNVGALGGEVNPVDVSSESIKKLRENNMAYVKELEETSSAAEVAELALREAFRVYNTGGTIEDAVAQMRISFEIGDVNQSLAEQAINDFVEGMGDEDPERARAAVIAYFDKAMTGTFDEVFAKMDSKNWWERIFDPGVSNQAETAGIRLGNEIFMGLEAAQDRNDKVLLLEDYIGQFDAKDNDVFASYLRENSELLDEFNVDSIAKAEALSNAVNESMKDNPSALSFQWEGMNMSIEQALFALGGMNNALNKNAEAEKIVAQEIASSYGIRGRELNQIRTLNDLLEKQFPNAMRSAEVNRLYTEALRDASRAGEVLTTTQRKELRASILAAQGMDKVAGSTSGAANAAGDAEDDIAGLNSEMEKLAPTAKDYASALKDTMTSATSAVADEAARVFDEANERELNGMEAAADRRINALEAEKDASAAAYDSRMDALKEENERALKDFDDRWENVLDRHSDGWEDRINNEEKAYDARLDAIQKQIDAEEEAEERRQEMFDNEIDRIKRLAEEYNRNVDIGTALASGDVDAAAKLANDAAASSNTNAIEQARDALAKTSEGRVDALQDRMDIINSEKDSRLDALKEVEEAEKKALNDRRDREREGLQATVEAAEKGLQAQREAAEKAKSAQIDAARQSSSNAIDARKRQQQANQRALDAELLALQQHVPRNESEYRAHVAQLEGIYRKYGVNLSTSARGWNATVTNELVVASRNSAESIKNDIDWRAVGNKIVEDMAKAVNLTPEQMLNFLTTGIYKPTPGANGMRSLAAGGSTALHIGGGVSQKDRTGVPRSASMYPSEYSAVLKQGEFVMNQHAVRTYGMDTMNALNNRTIGANTFLHSGGALNWPTTAGGMGGAMGVQTVMRMALMNAIMQSMGEVSSMSAIPGSSAPGPSRPVGGAPVGAPSASGGIPALLSFGRMLMARGISVSENKALGDNPRPGSHSRTGYHYKYDNSGAIDVNSHAGESLAEKRALSPIVQEALRAGFGVQWLSPGHYNHAHFDVGSYRNVGNMAPYLHQGGVPSAQVGAMIRHDNTLVNTHRGETVLTASLTRDLRDGIQQGVGGSSKSVVVEFNNPVVRSEADLNAMVGIVEKALDKIDTKNGRRRTVR